MAKKTGLGKGLEALFGEDLISKTIENKEENNKDKDLIIKVKLTEIEPNKNQPRKKFDEESIEELANSIKEYGLIQPIVVAKKDKYYEIIAGERRWRASKKAGLKEVPVIIREDNERRNKEIALIENIQREDLKSCRYIRKSKK